MVLIIGKGSVEAAVLDYMVHQGSIAGPLFQFSDGRFLTRSRFVSAVRSALPQAVFGILGIASGSVRQPWLRCVGYKIP